MANADNAEKHKQHQQELAALKTELSKKEKEITELRKQLEELKNGNKTLGELFI